MEDIFRESISKPKENFISQYIITVLKIAYTKVIENGFDSISQLALAEINILNNTIRIKTA
jgi:hypothetical protein